MTATGLDEGGRQAYLAALGIPLWSVQHPLPGAAPAAALVFQPWLVEEEAFAAESALTTHADEGTSAPGPTAAAVAETRPLQVSEPAFKAAPSSQAMTPAKAATPVAAARAALSAMDAFPRFSFFLRSYEGWQLIISLGEAPDLSRREHALLAQIESVLAVTGGGSQTHFRWPLNNNPAIPRDAQAAREAVGAFMRRAHQAGSRYLLLGDALAPFFAQALAETRLAQGASLAELLAQPLLKRELWRSLAQTA